MSNFIINFDINRSIKNCPPLYPKGVNFEDRVLMDRESILTVDEQGVSLQIRLRDHVRENELKLIDSFTNRGWIYSEKPIVVERCLDGNHRLIAGFNRMVAFKELDLTKVLVDVVTFDTPADRIKYMVLSNEGHLPAEDNDDKDYVKALKKAVMSKCFRRDDTQGIKDYLREMAPSKSPAQLTSIFKKFRAVTSAYENVLDVDASVANSILSKHGYPCKGVVLQEDEDGEPFAQIGFARSNGDFGTKVKQMLDLYDKYQVPVEIYGYILNVDPSRIQDQRETWVDSFDSTMLWVKQHLNRKYHKAFQFCGFIGQITESDPNNFGVRKEDIIVDVNGEAI